MRQLHISDRETGANGVYDCGFHASSSGISPRRGPMVATLRHYMKVNFEGKLHILVAGMVPVRRRWAGEN
jgi:hypothetical protein